MRKSRLFTPGPCEVPPEVLLELAKPVFHHRTDEFRSLFKRVRSDLQELFGTDDDVIALTSSGTGGMEASVLSTVPAGKKALVVSAGKWGERWEEICKLHGIPAVVLKADYGKAITAEQVGTALAADKDIAAVFTTLSETSTGVCMDVAGHAAAARKAPQEVLVIVDAISGFLADEMPVKAWGIDIAVAGSQKALMLPPGLAFLSVSQRAWKRMETMPARSYYFDLKAYRKTAADDDTPYTSAHTLLLATAKACELIKKSGAGNLRAHIARQARAVRAAAAALGLKNFAERPGNAVSVLVPPAGTADKIVKALKSDFGLTIAGGQGSMKGNIFRIGHIGYIDDLDTLGVLGALELAMGKLGLAVKPGAACAAALEVFGGKA